MNYNYNLDEVILLSKLASLIASDDFKSTERFVIRTKKNNIDPEKIYETILQTHLFCGFPAAIESLKIFSTHYTDFYPKISKNNTSLFRILGNHNCKLIYKNNFKKLISNIAKISPDLKDWMLTDGYGKVMGRKGLNLAEREFINVSILCTRFYENQLHSHIKGCLNLDIKLFDIKLVLSELSDIAGKKNIQSALRLLKLITKSN